MKRLFETLRAELAEQRAGLGMTPEQQLYDFLLGTAALAVVFLSLGALVVMAP